MCGTQSSSQLLIVANRRNRLFRRQIIVGECHKFTPEVKTEGCNCPKEGKAEPYHVTTLKIQHTWSLH